MMRRACILSRQQSVIGCVRNDFVWAVFKKCSKGMLHDPFVGPFTVNDAVGGNAYRLNVPSTWRIHDVVNVSIYSIIFVTLTTNMDNNLAMPSETSY